MKAQGEVSLHSNLTHSPFQDKEVNLTRKTGDSLGKAVATGKASGDRTGQGTQDLKKWVSAALKDAASARKDTVKLKFH